MFATKCLSYKVASPTVQSAWAGHPSTASSLGGAEDSTASPMPGARVELLQLQLPTNFTQKIRLPLANTLLRTPSSCRLRKIAPPRSAGKAWPGAAMTVLLEEGRSKWQESEIALNRGSGWRTVPHTRFANRNAIPQQPILS